MQDIKWRITRQAYMIFDKLFDTLHYKLWISCFACKVNEAGDI